MPDKVRVMRILVYEGEREFVERSLSSSGVPLNGVYTIPLSNNKIKSAIMEDFPEILKEEEE